MHLSGYETPRDRSPKLTDPLCGSKGRYQTLRGFSRRKRKAPGRTWEGGRSNTVEEGRRVRNQCPIGLLAFLSGSFGLLRKSQGLPHAESPRAGLRLNWIWDRKQRGRKKACCREGQGTNWYRPEAQAQKWRVIYLLSHHKPEVGYAETSPRWSGWGALLRLKGPLQPAATPLWKIKRGACHHQKKEKWPAHFITKLRKPMANGLNSFLPPDLYWSHCSPWRCSIYHQNERRASWYFTLQSLVGKWMLMKKASMFS